MIEKSGIVEYTPVGAPGDGGDQSNVREKDSIIFDAIQSVMHLTERQSVQLELELHLPQEQYRELTKQSNTGSSIDLISTQRPRIP